MNALTSDRLTPQLGFDFLPVSPEITSVNRPGATSDIAFTAENDSGIKAGDALSRMFVDDRVFRLGKTNWRQLLDHALSSGHTELYLADDGRLGLRMPGYRFGPITRMPVPGAEYVKRSLLGKALSKLQLQGASVKSGRAAAGGGLKVEWAVDESGLELSVFEGRRRLECFPFKLEALPMGQGSFEEDRGPQGELLAALVRGCAPDGLAEPLGRAAADTLISFLSHPGAQS